MKWVGAPSAAVTNAGLAQAGRDIALPGWFVLVCLLAPTWGPGSFAIDARLYQAATNVWLAGGDPWATSAAGVPYAAGPWSLLAYLPTAWLPLDLAAALWMGGGFAAAVGVIRRLGLPLWWLAFPPLVQALWNGNAQPIVLAALLIRSPWGVTLAGGLKLYGFVPAILGRRGRELAIAAAVLGATALVLPWGLYAEHRFGLDAVAGFTWNGSALRFPPLLPFVVVALWILRRRGAEWLATPALWPGTQHFYHVFALPALVGRPWLAAALAFPLPLLAPVAVVAYALISRRGRPRPPRSPRRRPG